MRLGHVSNLKRKGSSYGAHRFLMYPSLVRTRHTALRRKRGLKHSKINIEYRRGYKVSPPIEKGPGNLPGPLFPTKWVLAEPIQKVILVICQHFVFTRKFFFLWGILRRFRIVIIIEIFHGELLVKGFLHAIYFF